MLRTFQTAIVEFKEEDFGNDILLYKKSFLLHHPKLMTSSLVVHLRAVFLPESGSTQAVKHFRSTEHVSSTAQGGLQSRKYKVHQNVLWYP